MTGRENLYRGKRVNGEWVEGYYVKLGRTAYIFTGNVLMTKHGDDYGLPCTKPEKYQVIPETVGQYTGRDVAGVMIFEGDILRNSTGIYRVCWDDNFLQWTARNKKGVDCFNLNTIITCKTRPCTKIGNIHDNPELLKGA